MTPKLREIPLKIGSEAELLLQAINPARFAERSLGFTPDATQERVLNSRPRRLLLNCNRQWGKSTMCAIMIAHRAIFKPKSFTIIAGPCERQSAETLSRAIEYLRQLNIRTRPDRVNRHGYILPANGARMAALPSGDGSKLRSFSRVGLLVFDEASRVPDPLYYSIRPFIINCDGDIVMVSTPLGKRGFFYEEFTNNGLGDDVQQWTRYTVPGSECPRITPRILEEERSLGDEYFAQEYNCEFIEDGTFLFSDADSKRLFNSDLKPLQLRDRNVPAWQHVMNPLRKPKP